MVGGADRDHKFVAKVIDQLRDGARSIRAVTDKLGTPTYTQDFAQNLLALVGTRFYGRYHMACLGEGSRLDVAREIIAFFGRRRCRGRAGHLGRVRSRLSGTPAALGDDAQLHA